MSACPPNLQFKSSNRTCCRKMEQALASYSISLKWFWNLMLSLHFLRHPLYAEQPLTSFQSSLHLEALSLHWPSFSFPFFLLLVSCWFDWCIRNLVVQGAGTQPIKPKGSRDRSGTGRSMIRCSRENFCFTKVTYPSNHKLSFYTKAKMKTEVCMATEVLFKRAAVICLLNLLEYYWPNHVFIQ